MNIRAALVGLVLGSQLATALPLAAQATDPPYLSQFPSVERVKKAMVVSDPRETALRQIGALWQLEEILKALSGHREFRGFTPDEQKVLGAYQVAEYYVAKAVDSAFPGPYGEWKKVSDNTPYRYMRTDPRFGVEGVQTWTLLPAAVQDQYYTIIGAERLKNVARARADSIARAEGEARMTRTGPPPGEQPGAPAKDEETRQIRRCVESGRSEIQCMMEGFGKGVMGMVYAVAPGLKTAPVHGIQMSGVYPGPGKFSLDFSGESVTLSCADLVVQSHSYAALVQNDGVRISIDNAPEPIVLMVKGDGVLQGAGSTAIAGQIITGYEHGIRTWSDGRTEPITRPIYANVTRHCTIGTLAATQQSSPLGSMSTAPAAALNFIFGSPDPKAGKPAPVGMRMTGEYGTQAALDLEFKPEGVVVGCRDAVILRPYSVQMQGARAVISVQNGSAPFALTLGTDGSVSGSGAVRVDGRVVTGTAPNGDIAYAPRSGNCTLGSLAPAGAQLSEAEIGANAARASLGQPAAAAGPAPTASLGAAAAALKMPATGAGAVFQLENGLPAAPGLPNPLAGQSFLLLDVPLDKIVTEAGAAQAAGVPATKVLERACTTVAGQADCAKLIKVLHSHEIASLRPDQTGVAQSPELPVGRSYYLFGTAITGGRKYTWHLPLVAKTGWTKVTLGQANSVP